MTSVAKACPVPLRSRAARVEILVFEHPLAGLQLVKGSIEPGETPEGAAVREMQEEAGIPLQAVRPLGIIEAAPGQFWALTLCASTAPLPDQWVHRAPDDGGHDFSFFWQTLPVGPEPWGNPYRRILERISAVSSNISFNADTTAAAPASRARLRGAGQFGR